MEPAYRPLPEAPTEAHRLAAVGQQRRARMTEDPHALSAPDQVSDVRSTVLDEIAAAASDSAVVALGSPRVMTLYTTIAIVTASSGLLALVLLVDWLFGSWLAAPFLLLAALIGAGVYLSRRASHERRWLARVPLVVHGYLELGGREEHVERVVVRVRFAPGRCPELEFCKDVLTAVECPTQGVVRGEGGSIDIHSPEIAGRPDRLRDWVRLLFERALMPLHQAATITDVEIRER